MNIRFERDDIDAVVRTLNGLRDFRVPLERSAVEMMRSIDLNFAHGGRPSWAPLKPSTVAQRRGGGKGGVGILQDSGRLRASWQRGRTGNEYTATADHVDIGTNVPYAAYHEYGTRRYTIVPRRKKALYWTGAGRPVRRVNHPGLPARPMATIQNEDVDAFAEVFAGWFEEVL